MILYPSTKSNSIKKKNKTTTKNEEAKKSNPKKKNEKLSADILVSTVQCRVIAPARLERVDQ